MFFTELCLNKRLYTSVKDTHFSTVAGNCDSNTTREAEYYFCFCFYV